MDCDRTISAAAFGSRSIIIKLPSKLPLDEQQHLAANNLGKETKNPTRRADSASSSEQIEISRYDADRLVSRRRQQQTTEPAKIHHHHHLPAAQASPSKRDKKWQHPNVKWIALNSSIFIITISIISALPFVMITFQPTQALQLYKQQQQAAINWTTTPSSQPAFYALPFGSSRHLYATATAAGAPKSSTRRQLLNSHYRYDIVGGPDEESEIGRHQTELALVRDQLLATRRRLEDQLAALSGRRQVALGSPCLAARDCSSHVANSHCRLDTYTCACLSNHVEFNSTTCLPSALLGFKCSIDSQCEQRVANSFCSAQLGRVNNDDADSTTMTPTKIDDDDGARVCACKSNFIAYRRDKCLPGSRINEYCLSNEQCRQADLHSYCQWKIPNIYGTCKCPPNYKLLEQLVSLDRASNQSAAAAATTSSKSQRLARCLPRLGDVCVNDDECQLATPGSSCQEPSIGKSPGAAAAAAVEAAIGAPRGSWRSSQVASRRRCLCRAGFVVSPNKLACNPMKQSAAAAAAATGDDSALQASNFAPAHKSGAAAGYDNDASASATPAVDKRGPHYELVGAARGPTATTRPPEAGEDQSKVSSPPPPTTTSTSTTPGPPEQREEVTSMSSLGKRCSSSAECRARDPQSACIGGICECLKPTSKCRANSTGCHGETFQCRNGQCISWYFVCDQFRNCADGSDEDECRRFACPPEAFECANGQCLARSKLCNGRRDCSDGSDELHCHHHLRPLVLSPASSSSPAQGDDKSSILAGSAGGGADTERAKPAGPLCPAKAFTCASGQCLPSYVFCNGVQDCSDGSDEREHLCERRHNNNSNIKQEQRDKQQQQQQLGASGSSAWSQENKNKAGTLQPAINSSSSSSSSSSKSRPPILEDSPLVKADRLDINKMLASLKLSPESTKPRNRLNEQPPADGMADSSWKRRSRLLMEPARRRQRLPGSSRATDGGGGSEQHECPAGSFTCASGRCRSTAILCSGVDGCGDNSDENRCEVCQCEAP